MTPIITHTHKHAAFKGPEHSLTLCYQRTTHKKCDLFTMTACSKQQETIRAGEMSTKESEICRV